MLIGHVDFGVRVEAVAVHLTLDLCKGNAITHQYTVGRPEIVMLSTEQVCKNILWSLLHGRFNAIDKLMLSKAQK